MVWRVAVALLGSAIPFQVLGLLTAGAMGDGTPASVIEGLERAAGPLGKLALLAVALSSITGNSVNDNTASYSLISAGLRVPRVAAAVATAALGTVLAIAGQGRYADLYASYLVVTLYWVAPFIGIVLADWWCRPDAGAAAARGWTAEATLFVATSLVTTALFSSNELYTGPVARALGGADIGYDVGFTAAFGGTVLLRRLGRRPGALPSDPAQGRAPEHPPVEQGRTD